MSSFFARGSAFAIAMSSVLVSTSALAASRTIGGTVVSAANDPLPNAKVTVVGASGSVMATAVTDGNGRWKAKIEHDGTSTVIVHVEVPGFPEAKTPMRPDQTTVRTTIEAAAETDVEMEVQGEKILPESEPAAPTKYVLDSTLLTKMPGTRGDPFAAVTSMPSMGRPPALSTVYVVRGANPEETGTWVDGAPMPHAFHFGGLVAIVPASFVGSIGVVPGGFGVPYGRATAGIVDVTLASPRGDGIHAVGNLDAIDVGASLSTPLIPGSQATTIMIGARRSHVDAWIGSILGDRVAGDLPRYLDGQILVQHAFSDTRRIRIGFLAADDAVSVSDPNAPVDKPRSGSWKSDAERIHLRYEGGVPGEHGFLAVLSAGKSSDSILGENDFWSTTRKQLYGRIEGTVRTEGAENVRLTLGADVLAQHLDGVRVLGIPTSSFGGSTLFALRGSLTADRVEPGAWAQVAFEPAKGISIVPGVRFDRAPNGQALFQPRVSIRGETSKATALKGYLGLYARSNPFDAVDARDFDGTLIPVVVEPSVVRTAQAGVGAEHAFTKEISLILDLYSRASNGVLVPVEQPARPIYEERPGGSTLTGYYYPLNAATGRTRAIGAETLLRMRGTNYAAFIGYALSRAEQREGPNTAWRRAPFDQTHVLNAAVVWQLGAGWEAGLRFRLAVGVLDSPYPATEIAPKSDPNLDPTRPLPELPPLHSLDVRLEKAWHFGKEGVFAAYAEVRNVYDRRAREPLAYNYVYGYPVVGDGLPIIPNIGVRGSF
ncbi:MAG: TonB-dependent receptor [Polyangiales bacterium]